jgi:hypothetical protein
MQRADETIVMLVSVFSRTFRDRNGVSVARNGDEDVDIACCLMSQLKRSAASRQLSPS